MNTEQREKLFDAVISFAASNNSMRYQNKWLHSNLIYNELKDMRIFGSDNYAVHCKDIYLLFTKYNKYAFAQELSAANWYGIFINKFRPHAAGYTYALYFTGMNMNILEILVIHQ